MDSSDVLSAVILITGLFYFGWLIAFLYQVKLGLKKPLFKCTQCGNCCRLRFIELSKDDIGRMEKGGLKGFYDKVKGEYMLKRDNGKCIYLARDDACSVYELRPQVCRDFPFFKKLGLTYCRTASFCPAVDALKDA